jgi:hypothetical protein
MVGQENTTSAEYRDIFYNNPISLYLGTQTQTQAGTVRLALQKSFNKIY